jgi:hypothetical protein
VRRSLQAGHQSQDGRLSTAGRAEEHEELARRDLDAHLVDGDGAVLEHLGEPLGGDGDHGDHLLPPSSGGLWFLRQPPIQSHFRSGV